MYLSQDWFIPEPQCLKWLKSARRSVQDQARGSLGCAIAGHTFRDFPSSAQSLRTYHPFFSSLRRRYFRTYTKGSSRSPGYIDIECLRRDEICHRALELSQSRLRRERATRRRWQPGAPCNETILRNSFRKGQQANGPRVTGFPVITRAKKILVTVELSQLQ